MFLLNSRSHLVTATPFRCRRQDGHVVGAYLIPKLRYYFAEFLHPSCLMRLGILSPPTCVGLGYGYGKSEA